MIARRPSKPRCERSLDSSSTHGASWQSLPGPPLSWGRVSKPAVRLVSPGQGASTHRQGQHRCQRRGLAGLQVEQLGHQAEGALALEVGVVDIESGVAVADADEGRGRGLFAAADPEPPSNILATRSPIARRRIPVKNFPLASRPTRGSWPKPPKICSTDVPKLKISYQTVSYHFVQQGFFEFAAPKEAITAANIHPSSAF